MLALFFGYFFIVSSDFVFFYFNKVIPYPSRFSVIQTERDIPKAFAMPLIRNLPSAISGCCEIAFFPYQW